MTDIKDFPLCGLTPDRPQPILGITAIEIGSSDRHLWDAIRLFSAGRTAELEATLEKYRQAQIESGYLLTFGLLRIQGKQEEFENVAVEYAVNAGKSPPNWLEAHNLKQDVQGKAVEISLRTLTEDSIIEATIKMESPWPCVIDMESVSKFDPAGLDMFNECLGLRLSRSDKTKFLKAEKLVQGFLERLKVGPVKQNSVYWEFCLLYLRTTGEQARFAALADEYKRAGGVPMPWKDNAWRDERTHDAKVKGGFTAGESLSKLNIAFADRLLREGLVAAAKESRQPILVDFTNTVSGSITDMSHVHGFVLRLIQAGAELHFINVNEIISSILRMIGVDKKSKITIAGAAA